MANQRAIKAGRAFVELFMVDNKFTRGLQMASRKLKAFGAGVGRIGRRMTAVGGAMLGMAVMAAKSFAKAGDAVHKMAYRTGLATEFLSALGYAAELGGSSLEGMEKAIRRLQRSAYDAGQGSKTVADAFEALGVSVHDASGQLKPTEGLFLEVADALSKIENETLKSALAATLLGRSGTELFGVMDGLADNMREAQRVGAVITPQEAAEAAKFTDIMYTLSVAVKRVIINFGQAMAGPLGEFAEWITDKAVKLAEFVRQNQGWAVTILKVAAGAVILGPALMLLGQAFTAVAVGIAACIFTLGLLMNPFSLAFLATVALGAAIAKVTGQLDRVVESLGGLMSGLLDGVVDALAAGNIEAAMKTMWTNIELIWATAIGGLKLMLIDLFDKVPGLDMRADRWAAAAEMINKVRALENKKHRLFMSTMTPGKPPPLSKGAQAVAAHQTQFTYALGKAADITRGTFSAEAAGRMGGAASWHLLVSKATRETADNTKAMLDAIEDGGMLVGTS